jgi:hypothetical protein
MNTNTKKKASRKQALCRARLIRFADEHSLHYTEVAELLGLPAGTIWGYLTATKSAKYPRLNRCCEINAKLDDLDKRPKRIRKKAVVNVTPKTGVDLSVKPTTTVRELRWLVEGWRAGDITSLSGEAVYIIDRYRKEVNNNG